MRFLTIARWALLATPLVMGACSGLNGAAGTSLTGFSSYDQGKAHFVAGRYGLAIKHFESAVRDAPGSVEALNALAATYDKMGRYDLSARYYGRALAADPDSPQTLNNIGYSYLLQERLDLAVAYLRDAYAQEAGNPVVTNNRQAAEVALQDADLARARELAEAGEDAPLPAARVAKTRAPAAPEVEQEVKQDGPWIERMAPTVQKLVTQPQLALVEEAEAAGVDPEIAGYAPEAPDPAEELPDPIAAPLSDPRTRESEETGPAAAPEAVRTEPEERPVQIAVASTPQAPPVAGVEVVSPQKGIESQVAVPAVAARVPVAVEPVQVARAPAPVETAPLTISSSSPPETPAPTAAAPEIVSVQVIEISVSTVAEAESVQVAVLPAAVAAVPLEDDAPESEPAVALEEAAEAVPVRAALVETAREEPEAKVSERPVNLGLPGWSPAGTPFIELSNGTGRLEMAARMRGYLQTAGVDAARLTNADHYSHWETTVFYKEGWQAQAEDLADMLPAAVELTRDDAQRADIRVELGADLLDFDRTLYYADKRSRNDRSG